MRKRLFKGDHPDVAAGLNNLAFLYRGQGRLGDAEPPCKDALEMYRRLHKGDHPELAAQRPEAGEPVEPAGGGQAVQQDERGGSGWTGLSDRALR